jgi:hypothetical protein
MEKSIKDKLGELNLTEEEKRSRFDIKYKKIEQSNKTVPCIK